MASPKAPTPGKITTSAVSIYFRAEVMWAYRPTYSQACLTLNMLPKLKSMIATLACAGWAINALPQEQISMPECNRNSLMFRSPVAWILENLAW